MIIEKLHLHGKGSAAKRRFSFPCHKDHRERKHHVVSAWVKKLTARKHVKRNLRNDSHSQQGHQISLPISRLKESLHQQKCKEWKCDPSNHIEDIADHR